MDVWSGPRITALREALWDKDPHLGCHGCRWQMENGRGNTPMATYEPYDGRFEDNEYPKTMAFAFENTCNLECTICTGDLSSRIRSRREGRPPLRSPWDDQFFDDLREVLPHLDAARFLGGEPFMIKGHHRIGDMMIEDQIDTACHCTTNGTVWDAKVERALEHLPFSFHISVDAVTPETLRAVRHAIDPDALLANIPKFREYTRERGTDLGFNHCFMQTNYFEFADVLLLADSLDVHVEVIVLTGASLRRRKFEFVGEEGTITGKAPDELATKVTQCFGKPCAITYTETRYIDETTDQEKRSRTLIDVTPA